MTSRSTPSLCRSMSVCALMLASAAAQGAEPTAPPNHLKVAVVQMALSSTISDNRDRIVARIPKAAALGARVVVFPEGALRGSGDDQAALVDESLASIRRAAREAQVYVLFGGKTFSPKVNKVANWMRVVGPDGRELLHYEKLYDNHRAAMPGMFFIDGVPCSTMICADRWLRGVEEVPIQQGAQVSFELSNNFSCEWVPAFEWYWNVPRAMRNNVWVIFANSGNSAGVESFPLQSRHGHSAVIAPDGRVTAATHDNAETIVVAELDLSLATRAAAQARGAHPALRPFWEAGMKLQRGEKIDAPPLTPIKSAEAEITVAAAQTSGNLSEMLSMIGRAIEKHADLVVFPERAIEETALDSLREAARRHHITVAVGMEHKGDGGRRNSAFVIGPDGAILTRYDQLSAEGPFQPGTDPRTMWFYVKGVPAVVTIGKDALWTELAELAAVAGARLHVHLDHDPADSPEADLRQLQVWANLASFQTFSVTANITGSAIWDDLRDREERRTALWNEGFFGEKRPADVPESPHPDSVSVKVLSPFSANLIARGGTAPDLLVATRRVGSKNSHYPDRSSRFNPQMDAWYRLGADILRPESTSDTKEPPQRRAKP